jgi:hypothetical protein
VLNEIDTTLDIAKIRLQIECDNKHTYPVSLKSFVQKESTCRFCQNLARLDLPQIRLRLDPGYSVEGAYVNETSPLTFVCPNGTPYASNWNKYQSGIRCTCEKCGRFNPKKLAPETVHQRMKALRLKWIGSESEYESCNSLLTLQCTANPEHIPFTKKFAHMYAESVYCPDCQQFGISAAEREISSFLRDVGITVELKNRTLGFEIDIYLPDFKTGIEYHGLFYHNELSKNPNYHFRKWDVCNKNGITLVSIFEDEYVKHPRRIQDYLKSLFRKDSLIKITPADCEYGEISKSEALKFYKNFSVLGSPERNALNLISYGFRYGGTLVGVISYSSQCAGVSNEMCIERYAFNPAYLLVNGLNELVESFIRYRKDVVILVYIRDLRYPTLIAPSEFNLTSIIDSQFYFVKGRERKTQYQLRLPYEADISVLVEQRKKEGWVRIYDCGHDVWMKHITRS